MSWWSPVVTKSRPAPNGMDLPGKQSGEMALVQSLAEGSHEAFSAIYSQYSQRVFRVACQHTASREVAEEIAQETFLFLLRDPEKFDPARGELGAFLAGVARQLAQRTHSQTGRTLAMDPGEDSTPDVAAVGVLQEIMERQQWQRLHDAVDSLPEPYREIIVMYHLEELTYEQVAEALDCPLGTVRSRLSRAREMLARKLAGRHFDRRETAKELNP